LINSSQDRNYERTKHSSLVKRKFHSLMTKCYFHIIFYCRFTKNIVSLIIIYISLINKKQQSSDTQIHTCLSKRSLFADKHVTRYFVKLKNDPSTSGVKWSRDDLCNMNEITRNPRFCIICCCTVCDVSTSSHINPNSFAHNVGSFLTSMPSYGISSCEKSGNSTWIPPMEFNVECMECVTTALTSCHNVKKIYEMSIMCDGI